MFAKQIEAKEGDNEIAELLSGDKQVHVFVFLINLNADENSAFSRYLKHATLKINEPLALRKVITGLEDLFENDIKNLDKQGDLYEHMLGKQNSAGRLGAFRTPKHISDMMDMYDYIVLGCMADEIS